MKKGEVLELDIEKYAFEGKGVAKIQKDKAQVQHVNNESSGQQSKYVIFVEGAYPGDKVKAELRKIKKSYAEAKVIEIISPSSFRTEPRCKYFGTCGGCKQQSLSLSFVLYVQKFLKKGEWTWRTCIKFFSDR